MAGSKRPDTSNVLTGETKKKLDAVFQPIALTDDVIKRIMAVYQEQMRLANSTDEKVRKTSDHLMMNTFIRELLDGTEQGVYLGLDLGGTNFRVVVVKFTDGVADTKTKYYRLPDAVLSGLSAGVFDFIAESIEDCLKLEGLSDSKEKIPLGFTFSFPSIQISLKKSTLVTWTKTFKCPDGVGEDSVAMLEAAIERKCPGLPVDIVVVMSDTVSTLMAGNYLDKRCRIGLILGTGSNAAFVENIEEIEKWTGDYQDPKHVIVNVECGSTGDNGCLDFCRSKYEKELDQHSNHPGSFTFEKSVAGLYLGELARLVLVQLVQEGVLFGGKQVDLVERRWALTASHITAIESDEGQTTTRTKKVLEEFGLDSIATDEDVAIVREVCDFMSRRAAHTIAAAMAVLVNHVGRPEVTIAIDGSLYERHPKYHDSMMEIFEKYSPNTKVTLILAKDGSGQGGAFAAVSALKQNAKGIRCA